MNNGSVLSYIHYLAMECPLCSTILSSTICTNVPSV